MASCTSLLGAFSTSTKVERLTSMERHKLINCAGLRKATDPSTANGGDNGVDNRQLNAVNEAIRSHPVEVVGKELRGYMTAMEKISTAEGVGIGQVNS